MLNGSALPADCMSRKHAGGCRLVNEVRQAFVLQNKCITIAEAARLIGQPQQGVLALALLGRLQVVDPYCRNRVDGSGLLFSSGARIPLKSVTNYLDNLHSHADQQKSEDI